MFIRTLIRRENAGASILRTSWSYVRGKMIKDQLDGLNAYAAGSSTVNFIFDRYISTKSELRETTMRNYTYMYKRFIRDGFGKKKIAFVKYSDVLQFYQHLLKKKMKSDQGKEESHEAD